MTIAGDRYPATVPDTLDLAERAALAINALTRTADPEHGYEVYHCANLNVHPAYMNHMYGGPCQPKPVEALPLMRIMSGSDRNLDFDQKMMDCMLSSVENGLWWLKSDVPWRAESFEGDIVHLSTFARLVIALLTWYTLDRNPRWFKLVQEMISGLAGIAVYQDDYAFYPGEEYRRSGWTMGSDVGRPDSGWGGRWTIADGLVIRALSRWYAVSGDESALELASKLVKYALLPGNWVPAAEPRMIASAEHGHWKGHFHATTMRVWGLLEYALVTKDLGLLRFVRDFYEYSRNFGMSRIGFFPAVAGDHGSYPGEAQVDESCTLLDMISLAIGLSDSGVGDYWEDVDQYVRNHLVEHQFLRRDVLQEISDAGPEHRIDPRVMTDDDVIARNIGAFASTADPTLVYAIWTLCCLGNGSLALYKAWESIVRYEEGVAQVNLLLNRASPWLDLDSYLPCEGRVVLTNKTARRVQVRIPLWADREAVQCQVRGQAVPLVWLNNYLIVDGLAARDVVSIEFPMVETTEHYTEPTYAVRYTCQFKGNTLVDISPRAGELAWTMVGQDDGVTLPAKTGYPIYQREHLKDDKAPMKETTRYVSPVIM